MTNMIVMVEYTGKLLLFWRPAKNGTLKYLLTQDHMGLQISKRYSYRFHPMSVKRYEDIGYHGGIKAITFLGDRPSFKKIVVL